MKKLLLLPLLVLGSCFVRAQINYSANEFGKVPAYNGNFLYGTNMGYYGNSWDDKTLADIAAGNPSKNVKGAGSKSLHLPLPEAFLEYWGYNVRVDIFNHYATLGIKDNTIFLEDPSPSHRDNANYGCPESSKLWKNMYLPIWDGGANGTPVNDNNYLALYIYKTVTTYKSHVKFWEVINEPDLEYGALGDLDQGQPGNWFDNNPPPCSLPNLYAPIFNYIRMLRVCYEVIKYVDPTAYVAPGGLGKAGFLDALLRNTDNPSNGVVSSEYPLKGGAYFDALSFHSYPMYHLREWDNSIFGFQHFRHSDAAVTEYINRKNKFQQVLAARGYNNTTYPAKHIITTENGVPSSPMNNLIGSQEAQRNYVMKALVESQRNDIIQYYLFVLGDRTNAWEAYSELDVLGLYKKLEGKGPLGNGGAYNHEYNESGIAHKTMSDLLLNKKYDATRTAALNLPANVRGGAFKDNAGAFTYVLWAKTATDLSEAALATYNFPAGLVSSQLSKKEWNHSTTAAAVNISSTGVALTGTPIFLTETGAPPPPPPPPTGNCDGITIAAGTSSINLGGLSAPIVAVHVFNGSWTSVYNQSFTNSPGTLNIPSLTAGTYQVKVSFYNASWSPVCEKSQSVTILDGTPPPPGGGTPNCNNITITPVAGGFKIKGLTAPVSAVQVFNNSWASAFSQTYTNAPDSITVPSLSAGTYHVKVSFSTAQWSPICDKSQDATVSGTPPPGGGTPDCNAITITPVAGGLQINGLTAPVTAVQVFNSNWATTFNQTYTTAPNTITVPSLSAGVYHVKVNFSTASWSAICEKFADATVGGVTAKTQTVTTANERTPEAVITRSVSAAPNPFTSTLQVSIGWDKNEQASISVIDVTGREVYKQSVSLQRGLNRFTFDGSRYKAGSYYVRLVTTDKIETIKLIKQ